MNELLKQKLIAKNQKLIDMVIARAKRDFPSDIALIGLTGSFATNDFHEKSDLDLIIVNNTGRGWQIGAGFIFDGVGYDIYCTPWSNLEKKAELDCVGVSSLTDLQILYYASEEHLQRFNAVRQKALDKLAQGITAESVERADKHIGLAKQDYADMMLSQELGAVRYASSGVLYNVINSIVALNNTCIKRGVKRYLEELVEYKYLPENFSELCAAIIDAKAIADIKEACSKLLASTISLRDKLKDKYVQKPTPTYDNLKGWYEECWCNNRNKMIAATADNDKLRTFLTAASAQSYFDEMTERLGTKKYDLMQYFDPTDLSEVRNAFLSVMEEYLLEYEKVGRTVEMYDNFEDLYKNYMQ